MSIYINESYERSRLVDSMSLLVRTVICIFYSICVCVCVCVRVRVRVRVRVCVCKYIIKIC